MSRNVVGATAIILVAGAFTAGLLTERFVLRPQQSVLPSAADHPAPLGLPKRSVFFDALRLDIGILDALEARPEQLGPDWRKDDLLVELFASGGGSSGWNERWKREVAQTRRFAASEDRDAFVRRLREEFGRLASQCGCVLRDESVRDGLKFGYVCDNTRGAVEVHVTPTHGADPTVHLVTISVTEPVP